MGSDKRSSGLGNQPLVIVIGLIASIIGIFAFITGKENVAEVFSPPTLEINHTYSPSQNDSLVDATNLQNSTPTQLSSDTSSQVLSSTDTPIPPFTDMSVPIPKYPGLEIIASEKMEENRYGIAEIELRTFAGEKIYPNVFRITGVTKDIANNWTYYLRAETGSTMEQVETGVNRYYLHTPGYYSFWTSHGLINCYPNDEFPFPIVAVNQGEKVVVNLKLGLLEVGVLSTDNKVVPNVSVTIGTKTEAIDGSPVYTRCSPDSGSLVDERGVASFVVVEGIYSVKINRSSSMLEEWIDDITVKAGEEKVITIQYDQ